MVDDIEKVQVESWEECQYWLAVNFEQEEAFGESEAAGADLAAIRQIALQGW